MASRSQFDSEMKKMCRNLTAENVVKVVDVDRDGHCWVYALVAGLIGAYPDASTKRCAGRRIRERMAAHIDQDPGAKAWMIQFLAIEKKYKDVAAYKEHLLDDNRKMWCDNGGPELVLFSAAYKRPVVIIGPAGSLVHVIRADAYFVCPGIQLQKPLMIYFQGQHYQAVVPSGVAQSGPVTPIVKVSEDEQMKIALAMSLSLEQEKKKQLDADAALARDLEKRFEQEKADYEFALSLSRK